MTQIIERLKAKTLTREEVIRPESEDIELVDKLPPNPLYNFIEFMNSMMEGEKFRNGAEYAEAVTSAFHELPENVSLDTIRKFLTKIQHERRREEMDIEKIIEKKHGTKLLKSLSGIGNYQDKELAIHFLKSSPDRTEQLGALTVLYLKEMEYEKLSQPETPEPFLKDVPSAP